MNGRFHQTMRIDGDLAPRPYPPLEFDLTFGYPRARPADRAQVQAGHRAILQAIGARDEALSSEAARQHILSFGKTILRVAI